MKRTSETCTIEIAERCIDITICRNPRARRMTLRVAAMPGAATLVTPHSVGRRSALRFIQENANWLTEKLARQPEPVPFLPDAKIPFRGHMYRLAPLAGARGVMFCGNDEIHVPGGPAHLERRLHEWLKREARAAITSSVNEHASAFERIVERISIRDQKSRWGSCSPSGNMSFSWRLILAPPEILDYVCAHEAAHLVQMNHGPKFWKLVRQRIADPGAADRWLNQHGPGLHRYGMKMPLREMAAPLI